MLTDSPRRALMRRIEFTLIALGGLVLIFGWGIGHHEWARGLGWLLTGIGFAFEMVYGRRPKAARAEDAQSDGPATDESPAPDRPEPT